MMMNDIAAAQAAASATGGRRIGDVILTCRTSRCASAA